LLGNPTDQLVLYRIRHARGHERIAYRGPYISDGKTLVHALTSTPRVREFEEVVEIRHLSVADLWEHATPFGEGAA